MKLNSLYDSAEHIALALLVAVNELWRDESSRRAKVFIAFRENFALSSILTSVC